MRILFISTHNLATNPRLVKEIQLALTNGYSVDVICFEFKNWSYDLNLQIQKTLQDADFITIPANRSPFWPWFKAVALENSLRIFSKLLNLKKFLLAQAVSRRTILMMDAVDNLGGGYDLIVGHNYGAMYTTLYAAQKFNCKSGFDMEDYHPGEGNNVTHQNLIRKLTSEHLLKFDYVSFASSLIKQQIVEDLGNDQSSWLLMLNHFSEAEFCKPVELLDAPLQLIWFSQNINFGRGLERILPVLEKYHPQIQLTLIGNLNNDFYRTHIEGLQVVRILPPMNQMDLHKSLKNFDVGLAIEPGKDQNNLLAIGNKLLAYYQAGLFIVASDTAAHIDFFSDKEDAAVVTSLSEEALVNVFDRLLISKKSLRQNKMKRFEQIRFQNWESASLQLTEIWEGMTT